MVGVAGAAAPTGGGAVARAPARKDKGDKIANHHAWGDDMGHNWRIEAMDDNPGVFIINVKAYMFAGWYLMLAVLWEVCATIFSTKNFKISNDRVGLTRSAILLVLFIVIHAVGNLHVFMGPDDFNGYGYFYVRIYWTGFGLPANIVEEYILLSVLMHVCVGLKRTWDMKLTMGIKSGQLNLAMSGLTLLTFMTIHLFQFRFGDTSQFGDYMICAPPFLINIFTLLDLNLNLFWVPPGLGEMGDCSVKGGDDTYDVVGVRDIYKLEFQIFQNKLWCAFYITSVLVFVYHACVGWKKVTPALGVPKLHIPNVVTLGNIIFFVLGAVYISFPVYVMSTDADQGGELPYQNSK